MGIETQGGGPPQKRSGEISETRRKLVEEVFERFHKKLLSWCKYKLYNYNRSGHFVSDNPEDDARDIVNNLFTTLLTTKNPIDLTLSVPEIEALLNIILRQKVTHFVKEKEAQKRNPKRGLVSLDELRDTEDEDPLPGILKQYFVEVPDEVGEMRKKIEEALTELEKEHKKMADIIRKRYQEGKTWKEVSRDCHIPLDRVQGLEKMALILIRKFVRDGNMDYIVDPLIMM